jgi:hypothetical protein
LVTSLDQYEKKTTLQFLALKRFRDLILPEATGWDLVAAEAVLGDALREGVVRAKKMPNPRNPSYPTTTIELNRQHPAVQRILGGSRPSAARFQPVAIKGEPLSSTVIRERR